MAAIVIDSPQQNAAMVEKLALPFPILSDPDGVVATKSLDAWDTKGAMAKPATIAFAPDGSEIYRYVGVDLVDRPVHEEALDTVRSLGLTAIKLAIAQADAPNPQPGPRAASIEYLDAYIKGIRSSTDQLANRMRDDWDTAELRRTTRMAERYVAALAETRRVVSSSG